MTLSTSQDAGGLTQFKNRVARQRVWPTPFARALDLACVERGISLRTLSKAIEGDRGRQTDYQTAWKWEKKGRLPKRGTVRRIEEVLGLDPGTLEMHIPEGERDRESRRKRSERMTLLWAKRKNAARTAAVFAERKADGYYTKGKRPADSGRKGKEAQMRGGRKKSQTWQTRLCIGVKQACYLPPSTHHVFVLCAQCTLVLGRSKGRAKPHYNHFHQKCWIDWLRQGRSVRLRKKAARPGTNQPDLNVLIPYWLEHNVLGYSYGKIANIHASSGHDAEAVTKAVKRAAKWLPERWGQLFSTKRGPNNINYVLKGYTIAEVADIGKGKSPKSSFRGNEITEPALSPTAHSLWDPGEVVDTPRVRLIADRLKGKYMSKKAAARAIGVTRNTLNIILYSEFTYLRKPTWRALAHFLGMTMSELKVIPPGPCQKYAEHKQDSMSASITDTRLQEIKEDRRRLDVEEAELRGASSDGG